MNPGSRPPPSTSLCNKDMLQYCKRTSAILSQISQQVKVAFPDPASGPLHNFKPGDWVLVCEFRWKHWKFKRWQGPFQVIIIIMMCMIICGSRQQYRWQGRQLTPNSQQNMTRGHRYFPLSIDYSYQVAWFPGYFSRATDNAI